MIKLTGDDCGPVTVKIWNRGGEGGDKVLLIEQDGGGGGPTDLVSIAFGDIDELVEFLRDQQGDVS